MVESARAASINSSFAYICRQDVKLANSTINYRWIPQIQAEYVPETDFVFSHLKKIHRYVFSCFNSVWQHFNGVCYMGTLMITLELSSSLNQGALDSVR